MTRDDNITNSDTSVLDENPVNNQDTDQLLARITELETALAQAQTKAQENWDLALRTKAEAENIKRRSEKDISQAHKYAIEKFTGELVPVIDSMELGLAALSDGSADLNKFREGNELTLKMFGTMLEKLNIVPINPVGAKFNPALHQAMGMQEKEGVEPNTVLTVVQKGYQLHDRVIRPAMVIIAKAPPAASGSNIDTMA